MSVGWILHHTKLLGLHHMFTTADKKLLQENITIKSVFSSEQLPQSGRWLLSFDNIYRHK